MKTTERGWAGHFIGAHDCEFRRNTLIESGETRVVVSTVGDYRPYRHKGTQKIGANRYYETMVFHAAFKDGLFWDADVSREINDYSGHNALVELPPLVDNEANEMHESIVREISELISRGMLW